MTITRAGFYAAVVWTPDGFRVLCGDWPQTDRLVVCDETGAEVSSLICSGVGALNFLDAAASPAGRIGWVAKSNTDRLVRGYVEINGSMSFEVTAIPAFGQQGVGITWQDGQFVIYSLLSPIAYQRIAGTTMETLPTPLATSQGWFSVKDRLHWIDLERDDNTKKLRFPVSAGGVTIGQDIATQEDRVVGIGPDEGERFLAAPVLWQEPKIVCDPNEDGWVAVGRQLHGTIGISTFPPFPPIATTPDPPVQPPDPPPTPEVPVFPDLSAFVNSRPYKSILGTGADDQARRENAFRFSNTVAAELRTQGQDAGILAKPNGANVAGYASDILCLRLNGQVNHFDVVSANEATTAGTTWIDHGPIDAARFRLPDPAWLVTGTTPPVEPPVVPPPAPPTTACAFDATQILAAVDAQRQAIATLQAKVEALQLQIAAFTVEFPVYTGRFFGQSFTLTPKR